ncbi:PepSY domain-containing protein [Pontibacillus salipaludis]|uniref:PepSY domain-containing protein n=1 Tax=Pontibacillus salipaludis TaxID=1697394 RepID=A0ABQ1QCF5_9BACI|nr:PepSY domain-containing protein [Pontibacillus salipaludis]GGD20833.1 hypothetical protein GCM10011389_30630 [Pontibacillus salipaludis]
MKFINKQTLIISGITLGIVGGGILFESTDMVENTFASSKDKDQLIKEANLTEEEAEKIALDEVNGEITEKEAEDEDGTIVFEFNIQTEDGMQEVEVDGMSGEIIEIESENEEEDQESSETKS